MSNTSSEDGDGQAPPNDVPPLEFACAIEEYEGQSDECTLYPPNVSDEEITTRWITAKGDAFVCLKEMR